MFALIVQTVLLITTAFIIGCVVGCLARRLFSPGVVEDAPKPQAKVAAAPVGKPDPSPIRDGIAPPVVPPVGMAARAGARDNLKRIKGIGPQNEARLNEIGILTFGQIAAWTSEDERKIGELLSFPGRIERENWVAQAKQLETGASTDFSKRVDSGSVTTSVGTAAESGLGAKPDALLLESPREGQADALSRIGGVGNVIETKMARLGIFHFDQIAAMSSDELRWLDTALGFPGRAERENWQGEAREFAAGGTPQADGKSGRGDILSTRKL